MKEHTGNKHMMVQVIVAVLLILVIIVSVLLVKTYRENKAVKNELDATKTKLAERDIEIFEYQTSLSDLQQAYAVSEENGSELLSQLEEEKERNDDFEDQLDDITGTVGKLDKLSKTDPELLQKYSKVFFLNEHYAPDKFKKIDSQFLLDGSEP